MENPHSHYAILRKRGEGRLFATPEQPLTFSVAITHHVFCPVSTFYHAVCNPNMTFCPKCRRVLGEGWLRVSNAVKRKRLTIIMFFLFRNNIHMCVCVYHFKRKRSPRVRILRDPAMRSKDYTRAIKSIRSWSTIALTWYYKDNSNAQVSNIIVIM